MDPNIHYAYAETPLGQIHYREAGSGPPVVLFHESPITGRIYERALPVLGRRLRAIAPDLPGYSTSTPPPEPLSIAGYAERMALFLDALDLGPAPLVGNHTGGAVAIQLAVDHPERVPALVVLGCPLFDEARRRWGLDVYLEPFEVVPDGDHLAWLWARYQRIWGKDTPPWLLDLASTEFLRVGSRYTWAYQAAFNFHADLLLPRVECPTMFLVTEGDVLRPANERSVELTPRGEGRVIDRPWGQLPARDPEAFSQEVFDFLGRVGYLPDR